MAKKANGEIRVNRLKRENGQQKPKRRIVERQQKPKAKPKKPPKKDDK